MVGASALFPMGFIYYLNWKIHAALFPHKVEDTNNVTLFKDMFRQTTYAIVAYPFACMMMRM